MPGFLKTHPDAATAAEAIRRASALGAAGVPTPAARPGPDDRTVSFDRADGATGPGLLGLDPAALLGPLARLQAAPVRGLGAYDPFLRIRPRLALATSRAVREALNDPVPPGAATLHGDFHVGQLIACPSGVVWIVDLDDMAIGPPEADLANFVAHIATSGRREDFAATLFRLRATVCRAWRNLAAPPDRKVFDRYLRFALVRRHLKLREAGRPDFEAEVARLLSGATVRTFPSGSAVYPG